MWGDAATGGRALRRLAQCIGGEREMAGEEELVQPFRERELLWGDGASQPAHSEHIVPRRVPYPAAAAARAPGHAPRHLSEELLRAGGGEALRAVLTRCLPKGRHWDKDTPAGEDTLGA
jgi:hypothetical protein